jgi:hypothetical protein
MPQPIITNHLIYPNKYHIGKKLQDFTPEVLEEEIYLYYCNFFARSSRVTETLSCCSLCC